MMQAFKGKQANAKKSTPSRFCSRCARTISLLVTFVNKHMKSWAQAVRTNSTILVLHSGNHEIIGIRHRKSQTLYISNVIEPHSCSNPAYGKIQVGVYIAAIQDTIDRATQDNEAMERTPPADISLKNEE